LAALCVTAAAVQAGVVPTQLLQRPAPRGFVEKDGYLGIDAVRFSRGVVVSGFMWHVVTMPGGARGVTSLPADGPVQTNPRDNGMWVEFDVVLQQAGEVEVRVTQGPPLNKRVQGFGRYAVSFGDGELKMVNPKAAVSSARLKVVAGAQRLLVWCVDPGLVLLKVEVVRGKASPSGAL
jgi:hypothetical protein